jgi:hypothetical protein
MATSATVGDPACSLSAVGQPDPNLIPPGITIAIGVAGPYTCLIW